MLTCRLRRDPTICPHDLPDVLLNCRVVVVLYRRQDLLRQQADPDHPLKLGVNLIRDNDRMAHPLPFRPKRGDFARWAPEGNHDIARVDAVAEQREGFRADFTRVAAGARFRWRRPAST